MFWLSGSLLSCVPSSFTFSLSCSVFLPSADLSVSLSDSPALLIDSFASASEDICACAACCAFPCKSASSCSFFSVLEPLPLSIAISDSRTPAFPFICVATLPCTCACFIAESAEIIADILPCDIPPTCRFEPLFFSVSS